MTPPPPAGTAVLDARTIRAVGKDAVYPKRAIHRAGRQPLPAWVGICAALKIHPSVCRTLKWLVDRIGSAILLVLSAPIMLGVALVVKLSSSGPVLFRQVRVGLHGRRFIMLKFRTMVDGADNMKKHLAHRNETGGILFKIRNDPRITRTGHILRRSSLDELPQLWNVLRGEMSLVGPRPPVPGEVARYTPTMRRRLEVKPGMTGLWQVCGRSTIPHPRNFALDVWYVQKWCFLMDVAILFRTIPAVLSRNGAS